MFLAWAAYFEGDMDDIYFRVLLPRLLDDIVRTLNGRLPITIGDYPAFRAGERDRRRDEVASEICEGMDTFDLFFIHADTGGRSIAATLADRCEAFAQAAATLCGFDVSKAIPLCPKHETESWALTDSRAVCEALGFNGNPDDLGLPATPSAAETLTDPKLTLDNALRIASRRRRLHARRLLPLIAQRQRLGELRRAQSFRTFEQQLVAALAAQGFLR